MYQIQTTEIFDDWLENLRDRQAKARINARLFRAQTGNLGDHKSVGNGISEMRIDVGAGYRLYYTIRENVIIFILLGGDKSTQQADIQKAQTMKEQL